MNRSRTEGAGHARHSLLAGCLLVALGEPIFAYGAWQTLGEVALVYFSLAHAGWALALALYGSLRRRISPREAAIVLILLVAPFFPIAWVNHILLHEADVLWAPFLGIKLFVLGLAFIVPAAYWVNLVLIGAFGLEAVALWVFLDLGSSPAAVVAAEPWFTLLFVIVSSGLLVFRSRQATLAHRLVIAESRAEVLQRTAALLLRIRDQLNTPLQNISIGAELIARGYPAERDVVARIERAVERLRALRGEFSRYEDIVAWTGTELEDDPVLSAWLAELTERKRPQ